MWKIDDIEADEVGNYWQFNNVLEKLFDLRESITISCYFHRILRMTGFSNEELTVQKVNIHRTILNVVKEIHDLVLLHASSVITSDYLVNLCINA